MQTFINFYQNLPSYVSPEIFSLGPLSVRWYSLGYIAAFFTLAFFMRYRIRKGEVHFRLSLDQIYDCLLFVFIGVLIGGRVGYAIFYQFEYYFFHPLEIILPFRETASGWKFVGISGMSFHGGMLGFVAGFLFYCKRMKLGVLNMLDLAVAPAALGYTFGRLGNFMNGELYGRETDAWWGMYFLSDSGTVFTALRHPSQLYEAFFEGIVIFAILWSFRNARFAAGVVSAGYVFLYGFFRFFIEFFRQPDRHFAKDADEIGTVFYWMTMGQVLCLAMIIGSLFLFGYFQKLKIPSLLYPGAVVEHAPVNPISLKKKKKKKKRKKR